LTNNQLKIVSIIIPCYNQGPFLSQTLRSVFCQTYTRWECLIIDDGSTDISKKIAQEWCALDTRFKYFYKENGGLSSARNYGLRKSQGDFIQFLDSDDLIRHDKLELQVQDLKHSSISISDYFPFDDTSQDFVPHRYLSPFLDESNYKSELILDWENRKSIPCHTVLFDKKLLVEHHLTFDEQLENHEDWVFWVQLFYFSNRVINRKDILAFYRIHSKSMTIDYLKMRVGFLNAALKLRAFFLDLNEVEYAKLAQKKHKQIKKIGKSSTFIKLSRRFYRRIKLIFKN
jgi:glycosyltransferase involved in cell wall biosynthesis